MSRETKIKDTKRVICDFLDPKIQQEAFVSFSSEGTIVRSREYIPLLADEACVKACEYLYDSGLRTLTSGANLDGSPNQKGYGFIGIDYQSMSDENKQIADDLEKRGLISEIIKDPERRGAFYVMLRTPITNEMTVGEVEDKLLDLAKLFKPQDILYGRVTKESVKEEYFKDKGDGTFLFLISFETIPESKVDQCIEELLQDHYYDGNKYYFLTEELKEMHLKFKEKCNDLTQ